mgnify:CR=1 FL=1
MTARPALHWPGKGDGPAPTEASLAVDQRVGAGGNLLVCGDNLQAMDALLPAYAGKVDLVYLDPPFATGHDFVRTSFVGPDGEDRGELRAHAYADRWPGGIVGFLTMIEPRLRRVHRLLAPHGSLYVHVDPTVGHYIKILLDEIFGAECFQREIVWRIGWLSGYKTRANNWIRNHDLIFFYTRDPAQFTFNKQYVAYPAGYVRRDGKPPTGRGVALEDVWNANAAEFALTGRDSLDSIQIKSFSREKTGWATQKNESLLRRIVAASSNPGDLVADFFCGSGTTLVAAAELGRRWIGSDCATAAVELAHARLVDRGAAFDRCSLVGERRAAEGYVPRIIKQWGGEATPGAVHGERAGVGILVGPIDAPVTREAVQVAVAEAARRGLTGLDVVAWDWGFDADEALDGRGVAVTQVQARREALDDRARAGAGLAERPVLNIEWREESGAVRVTVAASLRRPERLAADMQMALRDPTELLESWSVEFAAGPGPMRPDERHHRTRAQRALVVESGPHLYPGRGVYTARVVVCDRFGAEHRQAFTLDWQGELRATRRRDPW